MWGSDEGPGPEPSQCRGTQGKGSPKSDEMDVNVLDFEHFLSVLQTVAKNKDQGTQEDYVGSILVFGKEKYGTCQLIWNS